MSSTADYAADMRRFVQVAADARAWGDNIKSRLARAARVLGITPRRAKALFYKEAKVIPVEEYMACKQIVEQIRENASAVKEHNVYVASLGASAPELARPQGQNASGLNHGSVPTDVPSVVGSSAGRADAEG